MEGNNMSPPNVLGILDSEDVFASMIAGIDVDGTSFFKIDDPG